MYIYTLIIIGLGLIAALAKTTGWRPEKDPNWGHAIDVVLTGIVFAYLVFNPF